jgi:hypothetical protein
MYHKNLVGLNIHVPITWTYNNQTERINATGFEAEDLYKFAVQSDDNSVWMVNNVSSGGLASWTQIAGGDLEGDMLKSTYDINDDGIVDDADKLDNQEGSYYLDYNNFVNTPDLSDLHSHANKSELDLVTDGDHDVRLDNPHNVTVDQLDLASGTVASDIDDTINRTHDRLHDLDSTSDHNGITGTEDNFMALDTNGLPKDSGKTASDFANSIHTHIETDITDLDHYTSADFDTDFSGKSIEDLANVLFDSGTPTDGQVLKYDFSTGKWKAEDDIAGTDETVKITSDDTTAGYLFDKIVAGSSKITLAEVNDGGDEDLSIDVNENNIDHDNLLNTHNLTTDIDHDTITNTHNLTTDIDHNQLTNYDINEHREINDSGTGVTDLWSADKINTELGGKSDTGHTHLEADITDLDHYNSADFDVDFATKNIEDLADVLFDSGTPGDGHALIYDSASGKWKAEAIGGGDMLKSVYDTNDNGIVDQSEDTLKVNTANVDAPASGSVDDGKILVYDSATNTLKYDYKGIYFSDYVEDETESTTTDNTNWQQKLRLTYTPSIEGNYIFEWCAEISSSSNNKGTQVRLEQDDTTELNYSLSAPILADSYVTYSGFKRVSLDSTAHTFDIDFKVQAGQNATARIRRVRLHIRKVK